MAVLLKRLWASSDHRGTITTLAATRLFRDFIHSMFNYLMFVSGGAFDAMGEIIGHRKLKEDPIAWLELKTVVSMHATSCY